MFCSKCGAKNPDDDHFCTKCGNEINQTELKMTPTTITKNEPVKGETISLVLSWLFGIFFLLGGLGFFIQKDFISGIPLILISILLIPPVTKWSNEKVNLKLSRNERITIIIILFITFAIIVPDPNNDIDKISNTSSQSLETTAYIPTSTPVPTPAPTPVPTPVQSSTISFSEFDRIFGDDSSLTDLQKKEEFKNYKDEIVSWQGYLSDVDEGWTGDYCVLVKTKSPSQSYADFKSCNPTESFKNNLLTYQIGDRVILTGTIQNYMDLYPSYYVEGTDINKL